MPFVTRSVGLWLAAWRKAAPPCRVPGTSITVRPFASDAPMRALLGWRPDWKTKAIAAILEHRPGVLIDAGANVGQTLLDFIAAPVRSSYVGFEPNITCLQHLMELISLNQLERSRIFPAGLADRSSLQDLHLFGGDADPGASTIRALRPGIETRTMPSAFYRFDDIADLLPEPDVALVKIDVEGSELAVLRGMAVMLREKRPWILCEVLHRDQVADPAAYADRCEQLMGLLDDLGYEVHRIVQDRDGASVTDLVRISAFPDRAWDEESSRECEYIFVPASDGEVLRQVLVSREQRSPAGESASP